MPKTIIAHVMLAEFAKRFVDTVNVVPSHTAQDTRILAFWAGAIAASTIEQNMEQASCYYSWVQGALLTNPYETNESIADAPYEATES